jgi:hypothetical protein
MHLHYITCMYEIFHCLTTGHLYGSRPLNKKRRDLAYQHSLLRLASLLGDDLLYDYIRRGFRWTNALFNSSRPGAYADTELARSIQVCAGRGRDRGGAGGKGMRGAASFPLGPPPSGLTCRSFIRNIMLHYLYILAVINTFAICSAEV